LFVVETDVPEVEEYALEILISPTIQCPPDERIFGINISMMRLIPREV
jgi:hypothetical protein